MTARPALVIVALAAAGASAFLFVEPHAAPSVYLPAGLGALVVLAATAWLLRELRPRDRAAIAGGAAVLGFLVGAVSGVGPFPSSLGFAGAFLPAALFFMAGLGRERVAFELARLEEAADDAGARPGVVTRATALRDEARAAARELDPEGRESPVHAADARAVYAYAAQVLAYARSLDGFHAEAVAAMGEVPVAWMPAPMRPLMVGNIAFLHLCAGDPKAALAALDGLPEASAVAAGRPVLRAARAMVLVHLDWAAEALELVGRSDAESLPPEHLRARYRIARALALGALGETEAAREALAEAVALPEGRAEVRRFRPAVPASAAEMVDGAMAG